LSYHFPVEKTLKKKMQAAMERFLQQAKPGHSRRLESMDESRPSKHVKTGPSLETMPGLLSFDVKTLEEVTNKRKRRAYEKAERAKVGSNRGSACEVHRKQKLKV
jgi:hypothetical protein